MSFFPATNAGSRPLDMINTSNPRPEIDFQAGDSWRADLRNASAGSSVYLHLWKDNIDLGVSGAAALPTAAAPGPCQAATAHRKLDLADAGRDW